VEYTSEDGESGEIELSVMPMAGADSSSGYFVAVQLDITQRKRNESVLL
jgi:hypothetical protein